MSEREELMLGREYPLSGDVKGETLRRIFGDF